jgi:hypothetical protein
MSIERAPDCVLETDHRGIPSRPTNMADVRRASLVPPPLVHVDAPPGFTHGAPDTLNPYATGRRSLPPTEGERG